MLFNKRPQPIPPEEQRVSMPGLEIAIAHSIKTVFVVDQTGTDEATLRALEAWLNGLGYFLHCVSVETKATE
jgi:hypothetical protein